MEPTKFNLFLVDGKKISPIAKVGAMHAVLEEGQPSPITYRDLAAAIVECSMWIEGKAYIMVKISGEK